MVITSHVLVSMAIATYVPNTPIAMALAFASHFVLDLIPHAQAPTEFGYRPTAKTWLVVFIDLVVAQSAIMILFRGGLRPGLFLIILAAILPDIIDILRYNSWFHRVLRPYFGFHDRIQNETWKPIGYISQILLVISCVILILVGK
jgi:hypothetical protein